MLAILISVLVSIVLLSLAGKRHSLPALAFIGFLPLILVYFFSVPSYRIYAGHGLMHAGFAYQILDGVIPPQNPLLAKQPIFVTWGYDYFAALISHLLNVTPFTSFVILNSLSLLLAQIFVYKSSKLLWRNRPANVLAVVFSIYCLNLFNPTQLNSFLANVFSQEHPIRAFVLLPKFMNTSAMPLGAALFAASFYFLLKIAATPELSKRLTTGFLLSLLLMGFVYPTFYWPTVVILGIILARRYYLETDKRKAYWASLLTLSLSVIPVSFYTHSLIGLNPQVVDAGLRLSVPANLFRIVVLSIDLSFFVVLILFLRRRLQDTPSSNGSLYFDILLAAGLFAFLSIFLTSENYKFLLLSKVLLGLLVGPAFLLLHQRSKPAAVALLILLLLPPTSDALRRSRLKHAPANSPLSFEDGMTLRFRDEERDTLYQWIHKNTDIYDVFFDRGLEVPIYARRAIFLPPMGFSPGYGHIKVLKGGMFGYDQQLIQSRVATQRKVFSMTTTIHSRLNPEIRQTIGSEGDIYLIARTEESRRKFELSPQLIALFSNDAGSVFRLVSSDAGRRSSYLRRQQGLPSF